MLLLGVRFLFLFLDLSLFLPPDLDLECDLRFLDLALLLLVLSPLLEVDRRLETDLRPLGGVLALERDLDFLLDNLDSDLGALMGDGDRRTTGGDLGIGGV